MLFYHITYIVNSIYKLQNLNSINVMYDYSKNVFFFVENLYPWLNVILPQYLYT